MEARDRGLPAYAETCPQYLFCTEDDLRGEPGNEWKGAGYVCTPPLRPRAPPRSPVARPAQLRPPGRRDRSLPVLHEGSEGARPRRLLQDPERHARRRDPAATCCGRAWRSGKISLNRFVEITSTAPAKIFGLYGKKGTLAIGADADIVVWDPKREKVLGKDTLHMRVDYSPFEGRKVPASPSHVLSRGELIVAERPVGRQAASRAAASSSAAARSGCSGTSRCLPGIAAEGVAKNGGIFLCHPDCRHHSAVVVRRRRSAGSPAGVHHTHHDE